MHAKGKKSLKFATTTQLRNKILYERERTWWKSIDSKFMEKKKEKIIAAVAGVKFKVIRLSPLTSPSLTTFFNFESSARKKNKKLSIEQMCGE